PLLRAHGQERQARVRDHVRATPGEHRRRAASGSHQVISGHTQLAAVIGSPVRHSRSPAIHNAAFAATGLDWVYVALEVAPGGGADAVRAVSTLGLAGLSVTMPHKTDAARACD